MKITKRQLRQIIKEEKQKLLEGKPLAYPSNAERMQGTYSDITMMDAVTDAIQALLTQTDADAMEDLGDEEDASMASEAALTLTVAQAFQAMGMMAQYQALFSTLR